VLFSAHEVKPLVRAVDQGALSRAGQAAVGTIDQVVNGPGYRRFIKRCGHRDEGPHLVIAEEGGASTRTITTTNHVTTT